MIDDPRELGGDIAGPGGPNDHHEVVVDATKAVLVDYQDVCKVDDWGGRDDVFALLFQGRINQSQDRARVMLVGDLDFLAAVITELFGVAERASSEHARRLRELVENRWLTMPHPKEHGS